MISSKNKKLVAVITLLCFMLTLFPTAAFAEENENIRWLDSAKTVLYICLLYTSPSPRD